MNLRLVNYHKVLKESPIHLPVKTWHPFPTLLSLPALLMFKAHLTY